MTPVLAVAILEAAKPTRSECHEHDTIYVSVMRQPHISR